MKSRSAVREERGCEKILGFIYTYIKINTHVHIYICFFSLAKREKFEGRGRESSRPIDFR